jgi:hypothetical protein
VTPPLQREQVRLLLLAAVLLLGSFQLGRLSERNRLPCRLRPLADAVTGILSTGKQEAPKLFGRNTSWLF